MTRFHSSNRSGTSATDGTPVAAAVAGEHQSGGLDLSDLAAPAARQRTGNGDSTPLALFEDVAAVTAVGNKEAILDELVELQKRCQIRDKTRPGRGLWYVDSKEELQQILSVKEAELLVLRHGPTGRIMGALIYQTQFSELGDFDAPLKVFLDGWQKRIPTLDVLLRDRKVGLIHAVFIDDGVFQEVGIPRGLACQYMQAYAVHEGLAQGVKRFVAIVRAGARANTALPFFEKSGWVFPVLPPFTTPDPVNGGAVEWQVGMLRLRTPLQQALVKALKHGIADSRISVEDNEPDRHQLWRITPKSS